MFSSFFVCVVNSSGNFSGIFNGFTWAYNMFYFVSTSEIFPQKNYWSNTVHFIILKTSTVESRKKYWITLINIYNFYRLISVFLYIFGHWIPSSCSNYSTLISSQHLGVFHTAQLYTEVLGNKAKLGRQGPGYQKVYLPCAYIPVCVHCMFIYIYIVNEIWAIFTFWIIAYINCSLTVNKDLRKTFSVKYCTPIDRTSCQA